MTAQPITNCGWNAQRETCKKKKLSSERQSKEMRKIKMEIQRSMNR